MARTTAPTPPDDTLATRDLAPQLRNVVMRLSRRLRRHAVSDITPSQLSALSVVTREGRITISALAEAERVQPPTITRVVDSLVHAGLAQRVASESDRRVVWVEPTANGRALVDSIRRRRDAYLATRIRMLSVEDRAVLARAAVLLERLAEDEEP